MNDNDLSGIVQNLMEKLETKSVESQHGAILSLGYLIERKILKSLYERQNFNDVIKNWEFLGVVISELGKSVSSLPLFFFKT